MISWLDILKLCIPFLFSLILILANKKYIDHKERVAKKGALWRLLVQDLEELLHVFSRLDDTLEAVKNNEIRLITFVVSQPPVGFASRLAELEPENSHIYNEFIARSKILIKGFDFLKDILKIYISTGPASKGFIVKSIERQIYAIKEDLIFHANAQLDILDLLKNKLTGVEKFKLKSCQEYVNIAEKKSKEFKDQLEKQYEKTIQKNNTV